MTQAQIQQLLADDLEKTDTIQLLETHISWVLLGKELAYKIKKPVKFSFLDFSTLEQRHFYCKRELVLNQRLAPEMYRAVVPIVHQGDQIKLGGDGEVLDYALQMKRMDSARQMHHLLEQNAVTPFEMEQIARKIGAFHRRAAVVTTPVNVAAMQRNFADILRTRDFLTRYLKKETFHVLELAVDKAHRFLQRHAQRLIERGTAGFFIDGHGDLHAGNIFLLKEPVIFDCLEFNDSFRQLDMLDEVAFLCLDLDFYQRADLAAHFLEHYLAAMPCLRDAEDRRIFQYFKLYRANVRLKVTFLKAKQEPQDSSAFYEDFAVAKHYFELFETYLDSMD